MPAISKTYEMPKVEIEEISSGNFLATLFVGFIVAAVCTINWVLISLFTGYQIGFMSVAVGFLIGTTG